MAPQVPVLGRLGRWLEGVMFGARAAQYRLFVRAVVAVTAVLVLANALAWQGGLGLSPAVADWLATAGAVAIAAFVLVGLVQLLVFARVLSRESVAVAAQAETLEESAAEVTETAEDLATTAETLE
ncbi:MAG: hypothetical protein ABEJ31_10180, partial [Haloarculaceae archaeon]